MDAILCSLERYVPVPADVVLIGVIGSIMCPAAFLSYEGAIGYEAGEVQHILQFKLTPRGGL